MGQPDSQDDGQAATGTAGDVLGVPQRIPLAAAVQDPAQAAQARRSQGPSQGLRLRLLAADGSARLITTMPTQVSASAAAPGLDFEQPLLELEARRRALEQATARTPQQ